ncbi:FG-GAP repeat domain-containing protein [Streptomyces sp. NPDC057027]|uniref:FG-GAP repeat domain-containing protein n=1 Tax=Streptomyces sp. NPDC057027 TaxID=3346004 RepID=UPI00363B45CD
MPGVRTSRHQLTLGLAVAVALAVTSGTLAAGPAGAAPVAVSAATQSVQQDVVPFPKDAYIMGAGPTGFLSVQTGTGLTYRWTRYADGATTVLPSRHTPSMRTDTIAKLDGTVVTLYDMATGADPVVVDLGPLGYTDARSTRSTLVATKANASGGREVHVISNLRGSPVDDKVTGLPEDAVVTRLDVDSPDTAVVLYSGTVDGTVKTRAAVVDLATHAVVEEWDTERVTTGSDTALSATHIAWVEKPTDTTATLVTVRRDTGETQRLPLGDAGGTPVELVGDWVTYGQIGGYKANTPHPLHALTARSLTTGATVKLLDDITNAAPGPDGTQMVRGGTLEHGEGLYRIAAGPEGAPVAELVASTGEPTALELVDQSVPQVLDFDPAPAPVAMNWKLSRIKANVRVEVVHTTTKKSWKSRAYFSDDRFRVNWNGKFSDGSTAHNGEYTWRVIAEPFNGIGPVLEKTGTFQVIRKPAAHDFNTNGSADLLERNGNGELFLHDGSSRSAYAPAWDEQAPTRIGTGGWNAYDRLLAPGNLAGSPVPDVVARDKSGTLWLYTGTGYALAPRVKIGGGWQIYNEVTGGSDLDGDGRPDLLATDKTGDLWLYKGTGNATTPFAPRQKTGHGWGIYNKIVATGDIGGGTAGDLVARDTAGVTWLYLGKGDGTFAPRTRIAGDWSWLATVFAAGDVDRDGHPDLLGTTSTGGYRYFIKGTGSWRTPFLEPAFVSYGGVLGPGPVTLF